MNYCYMQSPVGRLLLVGDEQGLRKLHFVREDVEPESDWIENREALAPAIKQLEDYFAGKLQDFDLPLAPEGTAFQQTVWRELLNIPYGTTISYGELAKRIGNPNASRAVGLANGSNPIAVIIPCHRVIGSNGKLTGYGGGLDNKRILLDLERNATGLLGASA